MNTESHPAAPCYIVLWVLMTPAFFSTYDIKRRGTWGSDLNRATHIRNIHQARFVWGSQPLVIKQDIRSKRRRLACAERKIGYGAIIAPLPSYISRKHVRRTADPRFSSAILEREAPVGKTKRQTIHKTSLIGETLCRQPHMDLAHVR